MKLILIRHGETYWNKERRIQGGSSDTELSEVGLKQANLLTSFLKGENVSVIVSSPLKRALDTAKAIASQHKIPVEIEAGLKEIEVGEMEGLSASSLNTGFSQYLMRGWQEGGSGRLPGGESFVELQHRSWACIERLLAEHKERTAVVVSHYFVILAIIFKALGLQLDCLPKFRLDTGGVSIIEFNERGPRLVLFNDTSY